jgi:hypothetical protein
MTLQICVVFLEINEDQKKKKKKRGNLKSFSESLKILKSSRVNQ